MDYTDLHGLKQKICGNLGNLWFFLLASTNTLDEPNHKTGSLTKTMENRRSDFESRTYKTWIKGSVWLAVLIPLMFSSLYAQDNLAIDTLLQKTRASVKLIRHYPDSAMGFFKEYIGEAKALEAGKCYALAYNGLVRAAFRSKVPFDQANVYSKEAVDSIPLLLSQNSFYYADALQNRSSFLKRLGQQDLAKRYLERSLAINLADKKPSTYVITAIYSAIGGIYQSEADWLMAISYYQKALSITPNFATAFSGLGWAQAQLGNIVESRDAYRKIWNHSSKRYHINAGLGIAQSFVDEGKIDSAKHYLTLVEQANSEGRRYKPQRVQELWGDIFSVIGEAAKALHAYQQAQILRKEIDSKYFQDLARGERQIGQQYARMAEFDSAHQHFTYAFGHLSSKAGKGKELPDRQEILFQADAIPILSAKTFAYLDEFTQHKELPKLKKGVEACELAYGLFHQLREERIEEANKLVLNRSMQDLFEAALGTCYALHQATQNEDYLRQALLWMERYQTGILYTERQRSQKWQELPDSLQIKDENFRIEIGILGQKEALLKREQGSDTEVQAAIEALFSAREAYVAFRKQLAEEWPAFGAVEAIDEKELLHQLRDLPRQTASIAYFWGKNQGYSLRYFQGKIEFYQIALTPLVSQQLNDLLALLQTVDYAEETVSRFIRLAAQGYQQWLSKPLAGISPAQLIIIPDGKLASLPFEALLSEKTDATTFRGLPYLATQIDVRYAHALSLLQLPTAKHAPEPELAVFAPAYTGNLTIPQNKNVPATLLTEAPGKDFSDATKAHFNTYAEQYGMLHLALHGQSDTANPSLAYLQFPLSDSADTRLYSHELYNMQLLNSLISLAACEVGDGKLEAGEGLMSLSRAFRYAGAATVLSSRWKADARVTDRIFPAFYRYLQDGAYSGKAFGQARRDFLAQATPSLAHPYFWANFAHWGADYELQKRPFWPYILISGLILFLLFFIFFPKK